MAKTIVNKHFDDVNEIIREQFHDNEEYAKGEILIVNGDEPSLWVLNKNNTPKQISGANGGNSGGDVIIDEEALNKIKEEITSGYTAADALIVDAYKDSDSRIISGYTAGINNLTKTISAVETAYKAKDTEILNNISEVENDILAHTVNGVAISENPILNAEMLSVGSYSGLEIPKEDAENVTSLDNIQIALKKIETMAIANALAMAAGLNDVNYKTKLNVNEISMNDDGYLVLENRKLNIYNEPTSNIKVNFEIENENLGNNDEKEHIYCELMLMTGDDSITYEFPKEMQYITATFETNTMYLLRFKYNYIEVIKLINI